MILIQQWYILNGNLNSCLECLTAFFLRVQTCILVDVNQPLPWFFTRRSTWKNMPAFIKLHVRITEEYEFDECLSKETQIMDLFTHCKLQPHISFLNARSQLIWVLASFEFYSITWRMISRSAGYKIHFQKQPPFIGNFVPCRCDILSFFEFILDPLQFELVRRPRLSCFHTIK